MCNCVFATVVAIFRTIFPALVQEDNVPFFSVQSTMLRLAYLFIIFTAETHLKFWIDMEMWAAIQTFLSHLRYIVRENIYIIKLGWWEDNRKRETALVYTIMTLCFISSCFCKTDNLVCPHLYNFWSSDLPFWCCFFFPSANECKHDRLCVIFLFSLNSFNPSQSDLPQIYSVL